MDNKFSTFIHNFIKQYNSDVFCNISKCKSLLLDHAKGDYKKEIRLLLQALELDFYTTIMNSKDLNITRMALIKQFQDEYFISEEITTSLIDLLLLELRNFKPKYESKVIKVDKKQETSEVKKLPPNTFSINVNKLLQGTYTEKLKTGGKINISKNGWYIEYYFPGPDLRYNGTLVHIDGKQIDAYITAWKENYEQYLSLKDNIPKDGKFETSGKMNMTIRIGGYAEGVCLKSYHMPVNSKNKLEEVITDYQYAKKLANELLN